MNQGRHASNSTWVGPGPRPRAAAFWGIVAALVGVAGLGLYRERRTRVLTEPIDAGIAPEHKLDNALLVLHRVNDRFRDIAATGPVGEPAPWPFRTAADNLLTGGDCGRAAEAVGAVFYRRGCPFRIVQINVGAHGASHVMVEVQDDARHWVLLDPLMDREFRCPRSGRLLGLDEIRRLPADERGWLPEQYRAEWSLFAEYRRTNWSRLGPVAGVVRSIAGDTWMREVSVRAKLIEPGRRLAEGAMVLIVLLVVARAFWKRRRERQAASPRPVLAAGEIDRLIR